MDHAAAKDSILRRFFQGMIKPVLGDCTFKDIEGIVRDGPFKNIVVKEFTGLDGFYNMFNPIVYGYGLK